MANEWTPSDVEAKVRGHKVIVFAKGTKDAPMCGFSARAIQALASYGRPFEVQNIFDHPSIRPALVQFSNWPTTPQVFIDGELIGGCDITLELHSSGDLRAKMDAAFGNDA